MDELIQYALGLGASDARLISPEAISVEARLTEMCGDQQCDGYGLTVNCPPHVMKPGEFSRHILRYRQALVFKFDVPTEILLTEERNDIARVVHETAAGIEQAAIKKGYRKSMGLAAGSCKALFCNEYEKCRALTRGKACRFPDLARPSMSGLGINFFELAKALGWPMNKITRHSDPDDIPMSLMAGMALIG